MTHRSGDTAVEIHVGGVVQGVGFRPFVYRQATAHDLTGYVRNLGDAGVEIVLEGSEEAVDAFLEALHTQAPPLSVVESIDVASQPPTGFDSFEIASSEDSGSGAGTIPPDTGICSNCLADVRDASSRYFTYWATSCVDCGPRYTVIKSLPYDRERTTMDAFPMCDACRAEYEDPADRRYHAQTIACPACGPTLRFIDSTGDDRALTRPIEATATALQAGEVIAIRGIGGTHLACLATEPAVIERLRERTNRPSKPFALMASDLEAVRQFATVDACEETFLTDVRRPICVLKAKQATWLDAVAPGLHTVGVMLPYAGLHHRLFDDIDTPLVMTSANMPGKPMCLSSEDILEEMGDVIDGALVHDRAIAMRCDDSVVRIINDQTRFLRRSRGWVPRPIEVPAAIAPTESVLAVGGAYDVTIACTIDGDVLPSQHIGDVDDPATEAYLLDTIDHLDRLFDIEPTVVAHDLHPEFVTTNIAGRLLENDTDTVAIETIERREAIQHHHAHAAAVLAEHGHETGVVITADGTGYGTDGTIWGGEVLDVSLDSFERVGGLSPFHLPGGTAAIEQPGRILVDLLDAEGVTLDPEQIGLTQETLETVQQQVASGVNLIETTSAGRLLDAVSAMLGICTSRHYQGEPAIRLEASAAGATAEEIEVPMRSVNGRLAIDTHELLARLHALSTKYSQATVAATAQQALASGLAEIALEATRDETPIGFTGGVAYNDQISHVVRETIEAAGHPYLEPEQVPPGDAGLSYGQTVVALARQS